MQNALGLLMLAAVLTQVQSWHQTHDRPATMRISTYAPRSAPQTLSSAPRNTTPANASDVQLIADIAASYGVPEGALYGIWAKESRGLAGGWSKGWSSAQELAQDGSTCAQKYKRGKCPERWRRLRAICSQQRDGRPICDASSVRTSYAMAMGPMQHMPDSMVQIGSDGRLVWADYAVDYDRDGVRDPHSLADAMAMTAGFIRRGHDAAVNRGNAQPWRVAVNRYFGAGQTAYYAGSPGKPGVRHYWADWQTCRAQGTCVSLIASLR